MLADLKRITHSKEGLMQDFMASLVVFLVALPLCMGIAIASGVPPVYGLISGIVGGLVVGFFTGSPLQVSGPAAGLTVIVWEIVQQYGLGMLGYIVCMAGILQWVAGQFKLGQAFRAVSPTVIYGMLSGIGVLILASQFHVMLDAKPMGSGLDNLLGIPQRLWGLVQAQGASSQHLAATIGVFTIVAIMLWQTFAKKKLIPAPLVAVILATVIANMLRLPIQYITLPEQLFNSLQMPLLNPEFFAQALDRAVLGTILGLAFVASAESLLCAMAVDQMHQGPRTDYDKELKAQGIGNTVCGLLGALPVTGVIVRSTANVEAGARSNRSAILHGLWLLLFIVAAPFVLELIPVASLAAILVFTGYKLINFKLIPKLWATGKMEVVIFLATIATIVVEDLLTGVLVGLVLSLMKLLYVLSHLEIQVENNPTERQTHVFLSGAATCIRLPQLAASLEKLDPQYEVNIHIENLIYIDHACLEFLVNWEKQYRSRGGTLCMDVDALKIRTQKPKSASSSPPAQASNESK